MAERVIYRGEPGTYWTNHSDRVRYQYIAALDGTCGVCLQYHTAISAAWPIPFHEGCKCIQRSIKPGQTAQLPFCDFRALLDQMDDLGKDRAIGLPNFRLLAAGLAEWTDIVTANRRSGRGRPRRQRRWIGRVRRSGRIHRAMPNRRPAQGGFIA